MPLTEFLKMSKAKLDDTQIRTSPFAAPSCSPDADCVELVWENGQIMMQGQSSKARRSPFSSNFHTSAPKPQDSSNAYGSRFPKFSTMGPVLEDFSLPVPSCELGLDHDSEMDPWLSYGIEDHLHNEYTSDFLRELSGVTINDLSSENQFSSRERKSSFQLNGHGSAFDSCMVLQNGNSPKGPSGTGKHTRGGGSELPQFPVASQHDLPTSGISDITVSAVGSTHQITSRESIHNPSSLCTFTSLRLQKLDGGQPSTSSGFTNFPLFSRPTALARVNHLNISSSDGLENDNRPSAAVSGSNPIGSTLVSPTGGHPEKKSPNRSVLAPVNGDSDSLRAKPNEEPASSNQAMYQEDAPKDSALQNQAHGATTRTGSAGEKNVEPVAATSSVCSGNSVERASNAPARDLKRKSRDTGETEGPSEEVDDDSEGVRKVPHRTGVKRSRAAEVHNLSERRRRDRINEKMRSLQELIPNCNKVDKASMLDEAIEYLKTLQLQVQMLSMGAGMYMPPMMLSPGMQPMQGAHMPHFSPMGVGLGMGMGFGMNMLDMNSGMKMMPFQGPHYAVPSGAAFHGIPGSSIQAFGHPGQGLPVSMQRAPVHPLSGIPPMKIPIPPTHSSTAGIDAATLASSSGSKVVGPQVIHTNNVNSSVGETANQMTSEVMGRPFDQGQAVNTSETIGAASRLNAKPS